MRSLLITPEFGLGRGGIQTWMYHLVQLFNLKHQDIDVFAIRNFKFKEYIEYIMTAFKYNLIILATWKMSLLVLFIIPFKRKKILIFLHGNELINTNKCQKKAIKYLAGRKNIFFVSNSKAVADIFSSMTGRKVDFIQSPFISIPEIKKCNKVKEGVCFFSVGRLVPRKNIINVIKALDILRDSLPYFQYYIAGDGREFNSIYSLVKERGLENICKVMGQISEKEKNELFSCTDFFLMPSIIDDSNVEGYGISLIEANCYGIPVLSGNSGGMTEAVIEGVTGLTTSGTVDDIVDKIKFLLNTDFDKEKIKQHALSHSILHQHQFIDFVHQII